MSPVIFVTYVSGLHPIHRYDLSIRIKDIGEGGMQKDVPNRRMLNAEC
jgi:hypothetical protein